MLDVLIFGRDEEEKYARTVLLNAGVSEAPSHESGCTQTGSLLQGLAEDLLW